MIVNSHLPATTARLSGYAIEQTIKHGIKLLDRRRISSPALMADCVRAGIPGPIVEICAGLLAAAIDDVIEASRLPRRDFERTKRLERVIEATYEPQGCALKLAIAASPVNGRALVAHWDIICEQQDVGRLAAMLNMETEAAWRYTKRYHERTGL